MKKLILILSLVGCAPEPSQNPLWIDAAKEVAYGQCSRWIECGTETELTWQECVDNLVLDFCAKLPTLLHGEKCGYEYPGDFEKISRCAMWYEQVTCGQYVAPCEL